MRHRLEPDTAEADAITATTHARFTDPLLTDQARLARQVVGMLGGRYSAELGIDVDAGDAEIERWFLAATLFGTRISARIAERAFRGLDEAGLRRIGQTRHMSSEDLVALLDAGGYARYDFRTATRLQDLSEIIDERYDGQAAVIGRRYQAYPALRAALIVLPGWGPVTVQLFLRELRGVWPGAQPPLDARAASGGRHLDLLSTEEGDIGLPDIAQLAIDAGLDVRDLESGLVRLALAHHGLRNPCPGGYRCRVLRAAQSAGTARRTQPEGHKHARPQDQGTSSAPAVGNADRGKDARPVRRGTPGGRAQHGRLTHQPGHGGPRRLRQEHAGAPCG